MSIAAAYHIRPVREGDFPAIVGIYNWAVNQTFATIDSEPLSEEEARDWWHAHLKHNVLFVADTEGDGVVGWGRLLPWHPRGFDLVEDLVYIDPLHQGKGVGRMLLAALLEEADRMADINSVVASVAVDNRAGLHLHTTMGFETVGILKQAAFKFDRWMDITLVQKTLR